MSNIRSVEIFEMGVKSGRKSNNISDSSPRNIEDIRSSEIKPKDKRDYKCAPHLEFKDGSCIPLIYLKELAIAFNEYNESIGSDKRIKLSNTLDTLNPGLYKRHLIKEFNLKFPECENQMCWFNQNFMSKY